MGATDIERFGAQHVLAYEHELVELAGKKIRYQSDSSERTVQRQNKTETIATICVGPTCFDFMDDLLLFSLFRETMVYNDRGYKYGTAEQIEVKVLATLISRETCSLDEDGQPLDVVIEKKLKESIFVGQIHSASKYSPLKAGSSVTSLRRCPVQSRFVTVAVDALIPIPEKLDIGEAAAVVSNFVPAMGMLHHGRTKRKRRFSSSSLKGLDVLVTGGGTDEADAVISLALLSGADRVFVLQSKLSMASAHATSVRVELVSDNPADWRPTINRYVDVIVDLEYPKNFDALYGILKSTGRRVCRKPSGTSWYTPMANLFRELSLLHYPNASMYDQEEQIENAHADMVVRLLHTWEMRPSDSNLFVARCPPSLSSVGTTQDSSQD